jgi:hypothetical protein
MSLHQVGGDLVEIQVPAVDQGGTGGAVVEDLLTDVGAGVDTDR